MEYCSAVEVLIHVTAWMNLKNMLSGEKPDTEAIVW